jgi:hypothetical protein
MKKAAPRQVENAEKRLDGCPWCGVKPRILVMDEEGNPKGHFDDDRAIEYLEDPWSGLSFGLDHSYMDDGVENCPLASCPGEPLWSMKYDSLESLVRSWNTRKE